MPDIVCASQDSPRIFLAFVFKDKAGGPLYDTSLQLLRYVGYAMDSENTILLHRSRQGERVVEIFDRGDFRHLYFNGQFLQSKMSLSAPYTLVLPYTRYMMLSLLFLKRLRRILLIGLGAGSLVRYLHRTYPECVIDAVDHSPEVIDLARGYFQLPKSSRVRIHCRDGVQFLKNHDCRQPYDLILLDAFDELGMAEAIYTSGFFSLCHAHLDPQGILCANLWSGKTSEVARIKAELKTQFPGQLICPVPNRGNIIGFSFKQPVHINQLLGNRDRHLGTEALTGLDLLEMRDQLARSNYSLFKRVGLFICELLRR